ncbi:MAG TPA: ABC transporter substrate-binding protein [Anaerolineales bacterium]|nr:ABC transporter substrate-binding protein [Anaerolineales bacterium]
MNRSTMRLLRGAACAVAAAVVSACAAPTPPPTSVVYGLTLSPTGIDPHLNASAELGIPLTSVYDTLVVQDPLTGDFLPSLASSWTMSDDGLSYTFHLRSDVRFHDGEPFDAEAVRANIDYILDPDNHSQKAVFMLGPLERVEVIDPTTVVFHLKAPYPPLLDSLAQVYLGMASPKALATWGPSDYQFHQVGTGPFRFVEFVPNDHLTLVRNPDYAWGPSIYQHATAQVETVTFRFYTEPATRALAVENGDVDILGEIPPHDAQRLAGEGIGVTPVTIPGQPLQFLLNTKRPPTDELDARRALLLALDRPAIVQAVFGDTSPVAQGLLSGLGLASSSLPEHDQAEAERLLTDSGWLMGTDGVRHRDGQTLELTIVAPSWGNNPEVGQLLEAAWEALGAQVELQIAPSFGQLKEAQEKGDYNAIGINFFGTDPDLLRPMFASDGVYNWTGYRDLLLDDLLRRGGSSAISPGERQALYGQATQIVLNQVLVLPIRDYVNLVASSPRIHELRFSYTGWFPLLIDLEIGS